MILVKEKEKNIYKKKNLGLIELIKEKSNKNLFKI
jgi:hypothetical protein